MQHRELGIKLAVLTVGMFFFGFALVPLYDVFCDLTGLGGRTAAAPAVVEEDIDVTRGVRVEFVASVGSGAPLEFRPAVSSMTVHPGQIHTTSFFARNLTSHELTGQAVPSVAPGVGARYFKKIDCFCFTAQTFDPAEGRDLEVRFLVDPTLPAHLDTLTLSYTFYAAP